VLFNSFSNCTGSYPTDALIPFLYPFRHNATLQDYPLSSVTMAVTRRSSESNLCGPDHEHAMAAVNQKVVLVIFPIYSRHSRSSMDQGGDAEATESRSTLDLACVVFFSVDAEGCPTPDASTSDALGASRSAAAGVVSGSSKSSERYMSRRRPSSVLLSRNAMSIRKVFQSPGGQFVQNILVKDRPDPPIDFG
jgi:hypothetical protein